MELLSRLEPSFLPYEDDRRDLRGGILGSFMGIYHLSTWPDGYRVHGDTSHVKYFSSWNDQYRAIQKPVTEASETFTKVA